MSERPENWRRELAEWLKYVLGEKRWAQYVEMTESGELEKQRRRFLEMLNKDEFEKCLKPFEFSKDFLGYMN